MLRYDSYSGVSKEIPMKTPFVMIVLSLVLGAYAFADQTQSAGTPPGAPPAYILVPFGLPNYDFDKKLVNQTPADSTARGITLDRTEGGLRYVREVDLDVLGGVMALIPSKLLFAIAPTAIPAVGVFPTTGGKLISDREVTSREEAMRLPRPELPLNLEALKAWKIHDTMLIQVSGGVAFQANVKMGMLLSAGSVYVANGSWTSYVEKTGEQEVYLKFTRDKLRALDMTAGATLATVDLTTFRDADETFSFRFDLTNPEAVEAYQSAFRGDLTFAQKLASESAKAVRLEVSAWSKKIGHLREISIKIPLLFAASAGSGRIEGQDESISHLDGTRSESHFGIYNRELKLRRLHTHRAQTDTFFASVMSNGPEAGAKTETRIGSYSLAYADDHASGTEINSELSRFVRKTGVHEVELFSLARGEKLGYVSVKLELAFSPVATAALTELGAKTGFDKDLGETAKTLVDGYLAGKTDPDSLCDSETGPKGLDLEACRADLYQQATDATFEAAAAIARMKESASDPAKFSRRYAELGKALLSNRFGLKAVLGLVDPTSVEATFTAEGERISKLERKMKL